MYMDVKNLWASEFSLAFLSVSYLLQFVSQ